MKEQSRLCVRKYLFFREDKYLNFNLINFLLKVYGYARCISNLLRAGTSTGDRIDDSMSADRETESSFSHLHSAAD